MRLWLVATLLVSVGLVEPPKKPTDEEIAKLLVGKWSADREIAKGLAVKITMSYKEGGAVEGEVTVPDKRDKPLKVSVSGTWKVSGGEVVTTLKIKGLAGKPDKEEVVREKVLSIDETTFKYRSPAGQELERKRVKD